MESFNNNNSASLLGCGIVCEYNPFHNGHKYQIEYIKKKFGIPVVCAMSGNFVQRGKPSCMDKKLRAQCAVNNGADVVLEIPFPFSSMTAEKFARAGVTILDQSGMCSHIAFGSECADIEKLSAIAETLADGKLDKSIQVYQKEHPSTSYASARTICIGEKLGEEYSAIASCPNDILAIEYIKAIKETGSRLIPIAIKRTVNRSEGEAGDFASSSYVRECVMSGKKVDAKKYVPTDTDLDKVESKSGFEKLIHLALMAKNPEDLAKIFEINGGLEYAVIKAARSSENYNEMVEKLRCKTLTDAKIIRMLLFAFLGVTDEMAKENPLYTYLLAKAETPEADNLLRTSRKEKRIILGQRISTVRRDPGARKQYEFARNAEEILSKS